MTLEDLYPEWLEYKKLHTTAATYITRISSDWGTYYKGTPIIKKPVRKLTKLDLDKWAHSLIRTHDMTRKKYTTESISHSYIATTVSTQSKAGGNMFV